MKVDTRYLTPPNVIAHPDATHASTTRAFQGIPSLASGREGRLWAVWYGGITPGEDENNYVILAVSTDNGKTWSDEKLVVEPDGPVRAFDPEIWLAPDGKLWLFWAQGLDKPAKFGPSGVWAMTAVEADGPEAMWSEPRRLCDGGATWTERGAVDVPPEVRDFDEHMLVERRDGSLWMWVRTKYGIGESASADGGRTWSVLTRSAVPHVNSRFFVRRLRSGRLLLVRHDPENDDFADGTSKGTRSHLKAFLSDDDGASWGGGLLLDDRHGVSYPDGDESGDDAILITYDYDRTGAREILMASFTEEDVLSGVSTSKTVRLRCLVNTARKRSIFDRSTRRDYR